VTTAAWEVEGARKLRATLKGANPQLLDRLKAAHLAAATIVTSRARDLAPVGVGTRHPGALRASVRPGGTKTAALVRVGSARVPYAKPIHYGWGRRHIKAQPFVSRAAQETEPQWFERYHREVLAVLDTIEGATIT